MLLSAAASMAAAGCGSDSNDEPAQSTDAAPIVGDNDQTQKNATVGDTITIVTKETKLKVTVLGVLDPVTLGGIDGAEAGKRFAGVRIAIQNVGDKPYTGTPSIEAALTDSDAETHEAGVLTGSNCGGTFASDPQIAAGAREEGCLPYEVDKGAKPVTFEFAGKSGFVPSTAEWSLEEE